jgi:hypothetical protein
MATPCDKAMMSRSTAETIPSRSSGVASATLSVEVRAMWKAAGMVMARTERPLLLIEKADASDATLATACQC